MKMSIIQEKKKTGRVLQQLCHISEVSQVLNFYVMRSLGYEVRFAQICRYPYIYHLKTYKRSDLKTSKPNEVMSPL